MKPFQAILAAGAAFLAYRWYTKPDAARVMAAQNQAAFEEARQQQALNFAHSLLSRQYDTKEESDAAGLSLYGRGFSYSEQANNGKWSPARISTFEGALPSPGPTLQEAHEAAVAELVALGWKL